MVVSVSLSSKEILLNRGAWLQKGQWGLPRDLQRMSFSFALVNLDSNVA